MSKDTQIPVGEFMEIRDAVAGELRKGASSQTQRTTLVRQAEGLILAGYVDIDAVRTEQRFGPVVAEVLREVTRSLEKHGEQLHLPMGTGADTHPLDTISALDDVTGLRPIMNAAEIASVATLDTKAHSVNEGGDGTVTWWHILREEVFEAAAEEHVVALRAELVQIAAVAVKMIDALDAKAGA
ncbi:hypothetical protein MicroSTF_14160 [Microbacterium sp. STF-2]|uniref:hypothetical protein n=1 Tax=Microbacterium sp. STF-2 TaxID=3031132 RepID=UPI002AFFE5F9|nr:hypothetical protein [Microbacterium sp. STF-2]MEA1264183.1 hypothetical protein [Microbacterium sp. STF-2]